MKEWYEHPQKGIAINMWAPAWYHDGIVNLDIPELARRCKDIGADIVFLWQGWSQDHFGMAYYPTRRGPVHPNLAPGRDHMREIVDALHQYGIKVVAYYSYKDRVVWEREEDWRQVDEQGKAYEPRSGGGGTGRFGDLCPNSPYREYVIARQTEIIEKYEVDGTCLLDSAYFAGPACYCRYCQKKYKSRFGRNIPHYTGEWTKEWERYIRWKSECITELYDDMKAAHWRLKPRLPVTHFAFGCRGDGEGFAGLNYENLTASDTFVNSITQWNEGLQDGTVHRDPGYRWVCGMMTRYLRAVSGKTVHLHIGRFTYDREFQNMPEHELAVAVYSAAAAGACPSIADNLYPDGQIDEEAFTQIGNIYRKLDEKSAYLDYDEELPFAAIYYSKETLDYMGSIYPGENRYFQSVRGAYKFLIEQHIPVTFVCGREMKSESLKKYKVLILPGNVIMTEEEIGIVREYIAGGGKLIITGNTSLTAEKAEVRENFGLADVIGADYRSPSEYSFHYYDMAGEQDAGKGKNRNYLLMRGEHAKVRLHEDACPLSYIVLPATERDGNRRAVTFADDMHPGEITNYPAVVRHGYGKGECIYFAGDVFGVYGTFGYSRLRQMLAGCVEELLQDTCPVTLEGPGCVEMSTFYKGNEMRIHFVNYASDTLSSISAEGGVMAERGIPIGEMRLFIQCEPDRVDKIFEISGKMILEWERGIKGVFVKIPSLDTYEIIAVKLKV